MSREELLEHVVAILVSAVTSFITSSILLAIFG